MEKNKVFIILFAFLIIFVVASCSAKDISISSTPTPTEIPVIQISTEPSLAESAETPMPVKSAESLADKDKAAQTEDFQGYWNRTDVIRACSAYAEITNQTDTTFDFFIDASWAAHGGTVAGGSTIIAPNQAVFNIPETSYSEKCDIFFTLENNVLTIKCDGDYNALGMGMNVTIDGEYILGEPAYIYDNIVDDVLPTDELRKRTESLMGEEDYEQMLLVMKEGFSYISDKGEYEGFINGIGLGVKIIITEEGYIYCLSYNASKGYTFYTSDKRYKDSLPEFFELGHKDMALSFVYKDV